MDRPFLAALVLGFLALALAAMVLGWWLRRRKQRGLPTLAAAPAALTDPQQFEGFYVSTTSVDNPLDRIAVRGLGFRARTTVLVAAEGVLFAIAGQPNSFLPLADLKKVGRASWTIDRGVEPDGLVVIDWTLGERALASYFRMENPEGFSTAVQNLIKLGSDAK